MINFQNWAQKFGRKLKFSNYFTLKITSIDISRIFIFQPLYMLIVFFFYLFFFFLFHQNHIKLFLFLCDATEPDFVWLDWGLFILIVKPSHQPASRPKQLLPVAPGALQQLGSAARQVAHPGPALLNLGQLQG